MLKYLPISFFILFAGCSSLSGMPERSTNIKSELSGLDSYFSPTVLATYNAKSNDAEKKIYRDEVLSARLRAIDLHFNEFIKNISSENKQLNIGTDSTLLLLGAAGALSTVSSTQAAVSATSATVTGVKSSIDKNAYYDSTLTALVAQMQAGRKKSLVDIYAGMNMPVSDYPLMRALIDVENYFQAGTILGAVSEINKQAGVVKSKAEADIDEIVKGQYQKDQAGDALRLFWKPDGSTINEANSEKIKAWMKKNNIDVSITMFMRDQSFAEARAKAVKEISIQ